jgi:hypothetical protein
MWRIGFSSPTTGYRKAVERVWSARPASGQGDTRAATLDYIADHGGVIYDAVSSQPWTGDAQVRVSIVNWAKGLNPTPKTLWVADGTKKLPVDYIPGSLSPELDPRNAVSLKANTKPKRCFQGQTPGRPGFYLEPSAARALVAKDQRARRSCFLS